MFKIKRIVALSIAAPFAAVLAAAPASADMNWDRVAACESGNNWAIHTGNGFEGGLQFSPGTWNSYRDPSDPPHAYMADRETQIKVAERVLAKQGPGAWPVCSRR